jgi:hypothetical protein
VSEPNGFIRPGQGARVVQAVRNGGEAAEFIRCPSSLHLRTNEGIITAVDYNIKWVGMRAQADVISDADAHAVADVCS